MDDTISVFDSDGALSREYLSSRGYCCENGCRNCPYGFRERLEEAKSLRVVSLLPSATEIVAALGVLDRLVGVSHECDFPSEVDALPRVLHCPIYNAGLSSAEIDRRVRETIAQGRSLYEIDVNLLTKLEPDIILTQALCDVCAIGYGTVANMAASLPKRPRLLNLEPHRLDDLYGNIRDVAAALRVEQRAEQVIDSMQRRVAEVLDRVKAASIRPRVLFLEWIDPLFGPGHWTPELIELAGGVCVTGVAGEPSKTLEWSAVVDLKPEVVVVACCGYGIERIKEDLPILTANPGWDDLPAARAGEAYLIDGSQYFNRSGPRLIDSLEILAAALHPNLFPDCPISGKAVRV